MVFLGITTTAATRLLTEYLVPAFENLRFQVFNYIYGSSSDSASSSDSLLSLLAQDAAKIDFLNAARKVPSPQTNRTAGSLSLADYHALANAAAGHNSPFGNGIGFGHGHSVTQSQRT